MSRNPLLAEKKTILLNLPGALHARLCLVSDLTSRSRSDLVRAALTEFLNSAYPNGLEPPPLDALEPELPLE